MHTLNLRQLPDLVRAELLAPIEFWPVAQFSLTVNTTMLLHHAHSACAHFWWKTIRFLVHGSIFSEFGASSIPGAIQSFWRTTRKLAAVEVSCKTTHRLEAVKKSCLAPSVGWRWLWRETPLIAEGFALSACSVICIFEWPALSLCILHSQKSMPCPVWPTKLQHQASHFSSI